MGERVPSGQQVHTLPPLFALVCTVPPCPSELSGARAWGGHARRCPGEVGAKAVGQVRSAHGQGRPWVKGWGSGVLLSVREGPRQGLS